MSWRWGRGRDQRPRLRVEVRKNGQYVPGVSGLFGPDDTFVLTNVTSFETDCCQARKQVEFRFTFKEA